MKNNKKSHRSQKIISSLSIDNVIFGYEQAKLSVLLVKHAVGSGKGWWALPGDYLGAHQTLEECAAMSLYRRTGLKNIHLRQLHTFSDIDRFPNKRIITTAYFTIIKKHSQPIRASEDELEARWFPHGETPPQLLFDHGQIMAMAVEYMRNEARHKPMGIDLLPRKFTFLQLQNLYEAVFERKFDKPNFRRKISQYQYLINSGEQARIGNYRSATLYRFDRKKYKALTQAGFSFSL